MYHKTIERNHFIINSEEAFDENQYLFMLNNIQNFNLLAL